MVNQSQKLAYLIFERLSQSIFMMRYASWITSQRAHSRYKELTQVYKTQDRKI